MVGGEPGGPVGGDEVPIISDVGRGSEVLLTWKINPGAD